MWSIDPPVPQDIIEDQVHSWTRQLDKESKALGGNNSYPPAIVNIFFFYFCSILKMKRSFLEHLRNIWYGRTESKINFTEVLGISELQDVFIGFVWFEDRFSLKWEVYVCLCVCVRSKTEPGVKLRDYFVWKRKLTKLIWHYRNAVRLNENVHVEV